MKRCAICKRTLPLDHFHRSKKTTDGRVYQCRDCRKHYMAKYYEKHRDEWGGNLDRERARQYVRERYQTDPTYRQRVQERAAQWIRENPVQARSGKRAYLAKKEGAPVVDVVDYPSILERHGMICHICSDPIESLSDLHFDHVIPCSRGGEHTEENIRPAHAVCNIRKHNRLMDELTPCEPSTL